MWFFEILYLFDRDDKVVHHSQISQVVVLNQTIRLDALVLISNDEEIKKIPLVQNTCILNNVGGPSFVFKETCKDTITLHVYPSGFNFFTNPHFLKFFLNSQIQIDGISKHSNDQIDVSVVYKK